MASTPGWRLCHLVEIQLLPYLSTSTTSLNKPSTTPTTYPDSLLLGCRRIALFDHKPNKVQDGEPWCAGTRFDRRPDRPNETIQN